MGLDSVARISFIILVSLGVVTGVIFAVDPSLDLRVASFFRGLAAQPAVHRFAPLIETVRQVGPLVIVAAITPAVAHLVTRIFWTLVPSLTSTRATPSFVASPGRRAWRFRNVFLKARSGRLPTAMRPAT